MIASSCQTEQLFAYISDDSPLLAKPPAKAEKGLKKGQTIGKSETLEPLYKECWRERNASANESVLTSANKILFSSVLSSAKWNFEISYVLISANF